MVQMTGSNTVGTTYDPNAGSTGESQMTGGAAFATWGANFGGLSGTTGLLQVTRDENGVVTRGIDRRTLASTSLVACAAAASGAAAFSQVAGPGGAIAGTALGLLSTALTGGLAAYDAQTAIAKLKELQARIDAVQPWTADMAVVADSITYCLGKQAVRRNKGLANASIAGQPLNALWKTQRAVTKFAQGTKGVNRAYHARRLVEIAEKPKSEASDAARIVIGLVAAKDFKDILVTAVADSMKSG